MKENRRKIKGKSVLFIVLILNLQPLFAANSKKIEITKLKIASIDWCPQMCHEETIRGYVHDIVELIFSNEKYELDIHRMPWSRAIKMVNEGKYDALLAPAKEEAPKLVYPSIEVGKQQMCFFVLNSNSWFYNGPESLSSLSIGVAKDTFLAELNEFQALNERQFQYLPYLDRYVYQSAMKLIKGRIDTFLMTKNTTLYELKRANLHNLIHQAGCLSESKIYIAFTPVVEKSEKVISMVKVFEREMIKYIADGTVDNILRSNGVK